MSPSSKSSRKQNASVHILLLGGSRQYWDSLSGLPKGEEIEYIGPISMEKAEDLLSGSPDKIIIVDVPSQESIDMLLNLMNKTPEKCNVFWLFLMDACVERKKLLQYKENERVDCLIKPFESMLLPNRVQHLLNVLHVEQQLERELAKKEELLVSLFDEKRYAESLIESSMDMIISVDLNRKIIEFNSQAQEVFGYAREEIIGKPVDILYSTKQQSMEVYRNTIKRRHYSVEVINRRKNGVEFPSIISASVLVERGGKVLGLMGISRDISDWKLVESELKRAKEEAESASRTKSEFLANMSHEIRTPMTSVIGYGELLEESLKDQPHIQDYARIIRRNGEHLLRIINDILDISLVEKGKLSLKFLRCRPYEIITNMQYILENKSLDKGVAITVNYLGDIPEVIYSDPTRVLQCLVNLIDNAIKFTPNGGEILVTVEYLEFSDTPMIEFKILDTGMGISTDKIKLILQPFEQVHSWNSEGMKGVGLGLTITCHLAELLGGGLEIESQLGAGSTFTVKISCGLKKDTINLVDFSSLSGREHWGQISWSDEKTIGQDQFEGRVLLVEDNADIRKLLKRYLSSYGIKVDTAYTGQSGFTKALQDPYDLIFMDMQLPDINGIEVVRKLREKQYKKPIVALTAAAMRENIRKCLDAGCDDYAVKPITRQQLLEVAGKWLQKKKESSCEMVENNQYSQLLESSLSFSSPSTILEMTSKNQEISCIYSSYHNDPEMQDVIKEYVGTLPDKLSRIKRTLEENDWKTLYKISHGLRGSGGGFGFDILSEFGGKIEGILEEKKNKDKKILEDITEGLERVIERIVCTYYVSKSKEGIAI